MHHFILAAIGGGLVGFAAILMMGLNGRIAGVSGILSGAFTNAGEERWWRVLFVAGVIIGGAIPTLFSVKFIPPEPNVGLFSVIAAGLMVGIGTGIGSGCTSGHGICGISRLSPRSIVATTTFVFAGFICVYLLRHVFGVV
jgi:uncharacterized protein